MQRSWRLNWQTESFSITQIGIQRISTSGITQNENKRLYRQESLKESHKIGNYVIIKSPNYWIGTVHIALHNCICVQYWWAKTDEIFTEFSQGIGHICGKIIVKNIVNFTFVCFLIVFLFLFVCLFRTADRRALNAHSDFCVFLARAMHRGAWLVYTT